MQSEFFRFLHDDSGQGVIEYAMILAVVATGAIAALQAMGTKLSTFGAALDPFSTTTHLHVTIGSTCDYHITDQQSSCPVLQP
jgi:Flp pilus assembly pilin Flp